MFISYILICICLLFPYLIILFTGDTVILIYKHDHDKNIYFIEKIICFLIPTIYLIYLLVFELVIVYKIIKDFNFDKNNWCFFSVKIMSGFYRKFMLIAQAYVSASLLVTDNIKFCGVILGLCMCISQYFYLKIIL